MNESTLRIAGPGGGTQITIDQDTQFQLDGLPTNWKAVAKKGGDVVIYPKRRHTIIAFAP